MKIGDYDLWMSPCKCGHDSGKVTRLTSRNCWHCGRPLRRDFSDRALKKPVSKEVSDGSK